MTKRTEKGQGTQAGSEAPGTSGNVRTPLITGMTATRAHWLEWVQAQGLVALQGLHEGLCRALGAGCASRCPPARLGGGDWPSAGAF